MTGSTGTRRWEVLGQQQQSATSILLRVRDRHPELDRELFLMILNYDNLPGRNLPMEVADLRHGFEQMIRIVCTNYTFLPEPVDRVEFVRTGTRLPQDLARTDPGLVFSLPSGTPQSQVRGSTDEIWKIIKMTIGNVLTTLDLLHRNQVVIQALPRHAVIRSQTTYKPYFIGMDTLIRMANFRGYNPNTAGLRPDRRYCAPECYAPDGILTPATDMYAVGKLILQLFLNDRKYAEIFPPDNPFPDDIQNRINTLNLPAPWPRLLSLCLQPRPRDRFQDGREMVEFLKNPNAVPASGARPTAQARPVQPRTTPSQPPETNSRLPSAALVVCAELLTDRNEQFDFTRIEREFASVFNIKPRLYCVAVRDKRTADINPFFGVLKNRFGMELLLDDTSDIRKQTRLLTDHLKPDTLSILILIGSGQNRLVQELFRHPKARNWRIFWVRKGTDPAPVPIEQILDASNYIREKSPRRSP